MLLCIIVDYATRFMNAFFVTSFIKHELSECWSILRYEQSLLPHGVVFTGKPR
jgi:hypothetical protein